LIGTTFTFLVFGGFLTLVALFGLWKAVGPRASLKLSWMILVLGVLGILWGSGAIKQSSGQVYETESAYNYIQVLEDDGFRYLRLNEGQGIHSIYHPEHLVYYGPWMQVLAAPFFNPDPYSPENVESLAVVGLAAGTIARQATEVYGPIQIDGYEIDPEIIRVGQEYFEMTMPNLNPVAVDGRVGLEKSDEKYTIISIDAYRPPYIPWHLTTQEFFAMVRDHLSDDGVLVINVGRAPKDRRMINGLVGTIGSVFASVYVMDIPDTFNSIVYATVQPTDLTNFHQNYTALMERENTHPILVSAIQRAILNMQPNPCEGPEPPKDCRVFTDDLAPVEWITNSLVLNYVLFGELENLQ
jgi:spermidine synthase